LVTPSIDGLRAATTSNPTSAASTSLFVTSYSKIRIQNRIQSIKVDLKDNKVRKEVMQEFERYKVYFKSKIRIRMTKLTLTKTSFAAFNALAMSHKDFSASNNFSVTASVDGLVAADTAAINSAADTMAVPLPMLLPPVRIAGCDDAESESSSDDDPDDPDDESSSDDDSDDEVPLADDAFLSRRLPEAVDTVGAKEGATSLGATTTDGGGGGGRGLAAFNALAMSYKDFLYDSSSFFLVDFDCLGDFGATVVVEAEEFFFDSIVFLEEDFDCVGDLGASDSGTEGAATAGLALTVPGTVERVRS
jgi:hypothetical protein